MTTLFVPFDLPDGIILLITDELAAPADFFLHRTLATHIKNNKRARAVLLSVTENLSRWKAIAAKSNLNFLQHLDAGTIEFVDVSGEAQVHSENNSLRRVFDRVQGYLCGSDGDPILLILDDVSMLEWIGFPSVDVVRFTRALRAACLKMNATLLIRHHIVTPGEPDDLFRHLLQISSYHLEVKPLSSGRSGRISGEMALHLGFSGTTENAKLLPRSAALQYRLLDNGPEFFERGTSGGVL